MNGFRLRRQFLIKFLNFESDYHDADLRMTQESLRWWWHSRHDDDGDDADQEMSLRLHQCVPCVLGASPSRLLVLFTILVTLPASLNDQSKSSLLFSHSSLSFGETILQHGCFIHFFSKCIFKTSSLIDQNHVYLIIIPRWTLLFHRAAMEKCNQYIKCWSLSSLLSKCNSVTTSTLSGRHQLERKLVERHDSLKV